MLKHYVEYFYPRSFFSESDVQEIPCRGMRHPKKERAFGYREFSREEVQAGNEVLKGQPKDYSGMTYWGKVYTREEVEALRDPRLDTLLWNMRTNNYQRVVKTVLGNWQPLTERDQVRED